MRFTKNPRIIELEAEIAIEMKRLLLENMPEILKALLDNDRIHSFRQLVPTLPELGYVRLYATMDYDDENDYWAVHWTFYDVEGNEIDFEDYVHENPRNGYHESLEDDVLYDLRRDLDDYAHQLAKYCNNEKFDIRD